MEHQVLFRHSHIRSMGLLMLFGDISSDVGLLPDGTKAVYWETMRGCDETDSSFCSPL